MSTIDFVVVFRIQESLLQKAPQLVGNGLHMQACLQYGRHALVPTCVSFMHVRHRDHVMNAL